MYAQCSEYPVSGLWDFMQLFATRRVFRGERAGSVPVELLQQGSNLVGIGAGQDLRAKG